VVPNGPYEPFAIKYLSTIKSRHHDRAGSGDGQINVHTCDGYGGDAPRHNNRVSTQLSGDALNSGGAPVSNSQCCSSLEEDNIIQGAVSTLACMVSSSMTRSGGTIFHSQYPPDVSITKYVARMRRYLKCKASCYVLCVYYIDKLLTQHPEISFDTLSSHRLIMMSIVLAAKFHSDTHFSNRFYAKVGGVSLRELNSLERCFLDLLDWNLTISEEQYSQYRTILNVASCVTGRLN